MMVQILSIYEKYQRVEAFVMNSKISLDLPFKDYDMVENLYSQSESAVQSLFNFYLTILSAIFGASLIVLQSSKNNLGAVFGLLIFAIAIGIFYQSGIIRKYADQIIYAQALNEIRQLIGSLLQESAPPIYRLPIRLPTNKNENVGKSAVHKWEKKMWWLFPIGTHQLFITFVNSICAASVLWVVLLATDLVFSKFWQASFMSFCIFWVAIVANNSFATIKLNEELSKQEIEIFDYALNSSE